jgi:hypothetical protein
MSKPEITHNTKIDCGDYLYVVSAGEELSVEYIEVNLHERIGFGSKEEMIAVAQAMLEIATKV